MKLIDFNKLEVVEQENAITIPFVLELDKLMDLSVIEFQEKLNTIVSNKFTDLIFIESSPTIFSLYTDLDAVDLDIIRDNIVGAIVQAITSNRRQRESRLGIPKELNDVDMLTAHLMSCVNKDMLVNEINILFYDKEENLYGSLINIEEEKIEGND